MPTVGLYSFLTEESSVSVVFPTTYAGMLMPADNAFLFNERKTKPLCALYISSSECLLPFCKKKDILLLQLLLYIILHSYTMVFF